MVQRGERPLEVAAEERLGRLEEITFGGVGGELGDVGFLDDVGGGERGELAGFLDEQAGVGADFGEEELRGALAEGDAEFAGFGEDDAGKGFGGAFAVTAADEGEVGGFFAPLGKRSGSTEARSSWRSSTSLRVLSARPVTESARKLTSLNQTTRLPPNMETVCTLSRKRFTADSTSPTLLAKPLMISRANSSVTSAVSSS